MNMLRNLIFLFELFLVLINVIFKFVFFNCFRLLYDLNEIWEIIS